MQGGVTDDLMDQLSLLCHRASLFLGLGTIPVFIISIFENLSRGFLKFFQIFFALYGSAETRRFLQQKKDRFVVKRSFGDVLRWDAQEAVRCGCNFLNSDWQYYFLYQ